jgi:AraC-like DNA-binding protein
MPVDYKMHSEKITNLSIDPVLKDSFSIGLLQRKSVSNDLFYRINFHEIILIKKGSGTITIDDIEYTIGANNLFLLSKGQVYAFGDNAPVEGYSLCFGDCFWEKTPASASNCKAALFNQVTANQHITLTKKDADELTGLLNAALEEFTKEDYPNKPDVLAAYLKIIIIKIANLHVLLKAGTHTHEVKLYQQFLDLVCRDYQSIRDVTAFADKLGITTRKLSDLCRRHGRTGAKEIINGQLVAEAKRALQFTSRPIKEIAAILHFATPYHFSHFFKKNTGFSPLEYRKQFVKIGI